MAVNPPPFSQRRSLCRDPIPAEAPRLISSDAASGELAICLRIVRGPLSAREAESILVQYNQLAGANIPMQQFLRWVQDSPEGPAWHAILETGDGAIVGHTSLIPLRATYEGRTFIAAKSEYSFIVEEYRAAKIRGFEKTGRLKNLIYIDELFRHCRSEGWSPLLISTPSVFHRVFRSIACYPVSFPVWECLLVLRPLEAALRTPNLRGWQRAFLCCAGLAQTTLWTPGILPLNREERLHTISMLTHRFDGPASSLSFFQDDESLAWRYPKEEYERFGVKENENLTGDLIVKQGSATRYLRVCQWQLKRESLSAGLIANLVRKARRQGALGVRWAVYDGGEVSTNLVRRLQRFGFVCTRRVRTLLINTADRELLDPLKWNLTDAMFTFDL